MLIFFCGIRPAGVPSWLVGSILFALAGCNAAGPSTPAASPTSTAESGAQAPNVPESPRNVASPRVSGLVEAERPSTPSQPRIIFGKNQQTPVVVQSPQGGLRGGDISLNYVDADVREIARAILGNLLKVAYTIDPAVHGTATLQTPQPVSRDALLPLLESVLAQNGAALVQHDGIYDVMPAAKAAAEGAAPSKGGIGVSTEVVPLQYAVAKDLAKVLQPYVGEGVRMTPAPGTNALLVTGTSAARLSLLSLIRAFDVNFLAGQSYAIFPVKSDDPAKVANELERFARASMEGGAEDAVHAIPLARINAVLVVARQPSYLQQISRYLEHVESVGERTARHLYVYYVQNGVAADLASLLQKAFALPGAATSESPSGLAPNVTPATLTSPAVTPATTLSPTGRGLGGAYTPPGLTPPTTGAAATQPQGLMQAPGQAPSQTTPPSPPEVTQPETEGTAPPNSIRIIPDKTNNALLIYATPEEYGLINAALRKIDVLPLQVLIDAMVAEVTLNDALKYGTQWFFKKGRTNFSLTNATGGGVNPVFPGFNFVISGADIQTAISALQSVTTVKVISDPELVVLDNNKALLQVGDLVPIVTQSAVSVLQAGAPIVNSVDYRQTGVILSIAPRVNSGGLVTLDIQQEVSDVVQTTTSSINSPTISQRRIQTRVVVHDGETIGLGGLIKDSVSVSNSGIPWLTDIPILGALFGTRNNSASRTELLILLTPHVIHDQRDVRALTDELKERLGKLAAQPIFHDPIEPPGPLRSNE